MQYTETVCEVNRQYTVMDIPRRKRLADYTGMSFAANLKQLRLAKGWTQDDLAERLEVSQPTVQRWENGGREPRSKDREKLANIFGLTVSQLFGAPPSTSPSPATVSVSLSLPSEPVLIEMFQGMLDSLRDVPDPAEHAQTLAMTFAGRFQAALRARDPYADDEESIGEARPHADDGDQLRP